MEIRDLILQNREEKIRFIEKYINDYQVITLKANIPGINKQCKEAYLLLNFYDQLLLKKGLSKSFVLDGADGPMYIYLEKDFYVKKEEMMDLEEELVLGRFIDIDVFNKDYKSLNRSNLRKCYICNQPALVCARNKTHQIDELKKYLDQEIINELKKMIYDLCDNSILMELNLHPKFGLVTPYSKGSHFDMNYDIMIKGKNAILDAFVEMFLVGYNSENIEEIFAKIRKIGIDAEKKMFTETSGINTYKGLIFDLGLVVASIGYQLSNNEKISVFDIIKRMTLGLTNELSNDKDSFGKIAYQKYNIGGARLEAEKGFPSVKEIVNKYKFENELDCYSALIELIYTIEDTNLLKRCGSYEKYLEVKNEFRNLKICKDNIEHLSDKCVKRNLSFGGSADLLIVSIFLSKISQIFKIYL